MKSATKTKKHLAKVVAAAALSSMHPAFGSQTIGGQSCAINLTSPIHVQNMLDGEKFSAKIVQNHRVNVPDDTTLSGHIHVVTPDSRAPNNKTIELCFDTLDLTGQKLPLNCRILTKEKGLQVKRNGTLITYPARQFRLPIRSAYDCGYCTMGMSNENFKDFEKKVELDKSRVDAANKQSVFWNKRHGLISPNQTYFLSSKSTPFSLETTDVLWIVVDSPKEIPDFPASQ